MNGHDALGILRSLIKFDRLKVGPTIVEKNRISTPYEIEIEGKSESMDLIFKWEEEVFDVESPSSYNLACMIGSQIAINYGLFCREIEFMGDFDNKDRRFIRDMAENTAREIFVNKFVEDNELLTEGHRRLEPVKSRRYLNSELRFTGENGGSQSGWSLWENDKNRVAILSSGGKDSLLSFGLSKDLGYEVHPIFVNESGRHWFTAINAYRYFRGSVRNTTRVWENGDRVFNWFARKTGMVRDDFQNIRSDEYPLRLWTVAVFVFGALPLLRKRGIGRLIIGDEYDTTNRRKTRGIVNYAGLYDQSQYFDNVLSRYYQGKGWSVSQFSLLRPLSELLIEKILMERYPELHERQVSCHSAHRGEDKVYPCGKCEKCRRIVGMILALGGDPQVCGYDQDDIERCMDGIINKGVMQERAGREHLYHLFQARSVIESLHPKVGKARKNPEIMKLRFDGERSPLNWVPVDIRIPLIRILQRYSDGAVLMRKGKWIDFDPLGSDTIWSRYPFEQDTRSFVKDNAADKGKGYLWSEMTWPELGEYVEKVDIAILPVGSVEQHGPHLPLDTDGFDAYQLSRSVAESCSDPKPLVLPLIPYGVSYEHDDFPGTIGVSNDSLSGLVYDIGISLAKNGIRKLVIINGHGGNSPSLNYAAQKINRDARIFVCVDTGETSDVDIYKIAETPNDIHAGEIETSTSLFTRPDLVRMDKAESMIPKFSSVYLDFTSKRGVSWFTHTKKVSESGVLGDPFKASADKGEVIWKLMVAHLTSLVEDLKRMTIDELFNRRY